MTLRVGVQYFARSPIFSISKMRNNKVPKLNLSLMLLLTATAARAQLGVRVSPVKFSGHKVIVPLALTNQYNEKIESARAAVFLLDKEGKMVGQTTRWGIGGAAGKPRLAARATQSLTITVTALKPPTTPNIPPTVML